MPFHGVAPSRRKRARRPALLSRQSGVTIIEVLAAAAILGIGLVGVGSMVTYGVVSHRKSVNYTIASERATKELERVREAGYLGAEVTAGLFPYPTYTILNSTQAAFTVPELTDGQGTITLDEDTEAQAVDPDTGLPYSNMKQVQVDISWGGSRSLQGSYSVATLVSNRP
jgi:prepilin-type N-terminal cleavage/methylation domain-containing protein